MLNWRDPKNPLAGGAERVTLAYLSALVQRGHEVKALVRKGSEAKLSGVVSCVTADALKMDSYMEQVRGADTFVHLIGVPHPSPAKAKQFREIDTTVVGRPTVTLGMAAVSLAKLLHPERASGLP